MKHGRSNARSRTSGALDDLGRELVDPIRYLDGVEGVYVLHPRDNEASAHVWVRVGEENERTAWDVADILRERLDGLSVRLKERGLELDVSVMLDDGRGRLRPLRTGARAARFD